MEAFNQDSEIIVGAKQNPDGSLDTSTAMRMFERERAETIVHLEKVKDALDVLIKRIGQGKLTKDQLKEIYSRSASIFEVFDITQLH